MKSKNLIGGGSPITPGNARPIELRVLSYLDQRGRRHRQAMVPDLASPDSRIGRGVENGSNSFIPAIAARWCKRLEDAGLVCDRRDGGHHVGYEITREGRQFLRSTPEGLTP